MTAGRPPIWDDPVKFQRAVDNYFIECDKTIIYKQVVQKGEIIQVPTPEPYTMAGLAHHLGATRETLNQYKKDDRFSDIIAQARERIHRQNINLGLIGCHDSRISALNLASNFGYAQKKDVDITDHGTVQAILDALPPEIADQVREKIKAKVTNKK